MERNADLQKRLVAVFKQFVNSTLLKHFRNSEDTVTEWNYFSSLLSQETIDMDKIQMYLEVLSPKDDLSSPLKPSFQPRFKQQEDEKKTNSGIYGKKQ